MIELLCVQAVEIGLDVFFQDGFERFAHQAACQFVAASTPRLLRRIMV